MRLIIATSDSAAGCLKVALPDAKEVIAVSPRFLRDPAPNKTDIRAFFDARKRNNSGQRASWDPWPEDSIADWYDRLSAEWARFKRIEVWAEPDVNSQLILLQFLDWVERQPNLDRQRLYLVKVEDMLGDQRPKDARLRKYLPAAIRSEQLQTASRAWEAFRHSTPEKWAGLLSEDTSCLHGLRPTVARMLAELPAHDSRLASSEAKLLQSIAEGIATPPLIFTRFARLGSARTLDMFEIGKVIDEFAQGSMPIVLGLRHGPFDLALHQDRDKQKAYNASELELSDIGKQLVAREASLSPARINRWWGGVHLTAENCWRWNTAQHCLVPPN